MLKETVCNKPSKRLHVMETMDIAIIGKFLCLTNIPSTIFCGFIKIF